MIKRNAAKRLTAAIMLGGCLAALPAYAELFVISNSGTPVAVGDIKDVFTGEKQFAGSTKLVPVDNGPAQDSFLSQVLRMDAARYNTIWTKKSFREGANPPSVKAGDAEVLDFVRKTPGGVGYVRTAPSGVNVINKY
jgi:hypothetical protein